MRLQFGVVDVVGNFLAALLRNDAHVRILDHVAAVADDGGQRRDVVGIDDHFADLALHFDLNGRARSTARSERSTHHERSGKRGSGRNEFEFHSDSSLNPLERS